MSENKLIDRFRKIKLLCDDYAHIWFVEDVNTGEKFVLKYFNQRKRYVLKELLLGNEIYKYLKLMEVIPLKFCKIPEIVLTDNKSYLVMELIEGKFFKNSTVEDLYGFAKGLYQFNDANIEIGKLSLFVTKTFGLLNLSIIAGLFRVLRSGCFFKFYKSLILFVFLLLKTRRLDRYYSIHSDLINHENSYVYKTDRLALIDFENLKLENRWVYTDLLDISVDYNLECNVEFINDYINVSGLPIVLGEFRCHVWFSILRRSLYPARRYPPEIIHKISHLVIDKKAFNIWYDENFKDVTFG